MILFVSGPTIAVFEGIHTNGARFRPLYFAHICRKGLSSVAIIATIRATTVRAFDLLISKQKTTRSEDQESKLCFVRVQAWKIVNPSDLLVFCYACYADRRAEQ